MVIWIQFHTKRNTNNQAVTSDFTLYGMSQSAHTVLLDKYEVLNR